jgi:predicted regulator of Ras-like GTPase activity (Roadblock/LC7/MglB family)
MATLKEALAELAKVEGILSAVVISRDGFVLDGVNTNSNLDQDAVGAVVSAGIGSSERMAHELQAGGLSHMLLECEQGIIGVNLLGNDAVLATVADSRANIGTVRYQIKKHLPAIQAAL